MVIIMIIVITRVMTERFQANAKTAFFETILKFCTANQWFKYERLLIA